MSDSEERFTKEEENNTGDQSDHGSSGNASPREKRKSSRSRSPEGSKSSRHRSKSRSRSGSRRYRSRSRSRSRRSYSRSRSRSYHSRSRSRFYSPHRKYSRSRSRSPKRRRSRSYSRRFNTQSRNREGRSHSKSPMSNRRRHDGNRDNPEESRCLGVFGLSLYSTERDIREVYERYGPIEQCTVVYDHQTGRSRGFAFVTFESTDDAREAKDRTNGTEVDGRRLRVDYSITKRAHTPTPGIYMGKATYPARRERDSYYMEVVAAAAEIVIMIVTIGLIVIVVHPLRGIMAAVVEMITTDVHHHRTTHQGGGILDPDLGHIHALHVAIRKRLQSHQN